MRRPEKLKILWIATKPPWPVVDGGRLLAKVTLESLCALGHQVTLVAPFNVATTDLEGVEASLATFCRPCLVPARPHPLFFAWLRAQFGRKPLTIARHSLRRVRDRVAQLLDQGFDVIHVEQVQALAQAAPAIERGLPLVFRAQNVESELWMETAKFVRGWGSPLRCRMIRWQARELARWEGAALRRPVVSVALTATDARRLSALAGCEVRAVPAPFPGRLPAGAGTLSGSPALVLFGSEGWSPNQDAARWFVDDVWPQVRQDLPEAELHWFSAPPRRYGHSTRIVPHPPAGDSAEAFAPGSILVVPLRIGSGVRMKILEAWARGIPVTATPAAASGLDFENGRELVLARTASEFVLALTQIHSRPRLRSSMIEAGRVALRRHDPQEVARQLTSIYAEAMRRAAGLPADRARDHA